MQPLAINVVKRFNCDKCNYFTQNRYDFAKHEACAKHQRIVDVHFSNMLSTPVDKMTTKKRICICGKEFKERTGLWRHKKTCAKEKEREDKERGDKEREDKECEEKIAKSDKKKEDDEQLSSAIMTLIKQNQDLQKQLLEIAKENKNIINNTNTTNNTSNTNHFNLQVFLNETCKDALNMVDFVKLMRIELSDLEAIGRLGYTDGVSRIFVNGLKELDANKRPIHCSDLKREILYIKEDDVWEKDTEEKSLIKQAIRRVEHKNIVQIPIWVKAHPNCVVSSNKENTKYLTMVCESTGGHDSTQGENNLNKIIRNIAREVVIDKNSHF